MTGRLGAGVGMRRLTVTSDHPLQVINIVASTGGYWNNLSTTAAPGAAPADLESFNARFVGNAVVFVSRSDRFTLNAQPGERFTESAEIDGVTTTRAGSYGYAAIGSDAGRLTLAYDDGDACASSLYFSTRTRGGVVSHCTGSEFPAEGIWLGGSWFFEPDEDDGGGIVDTAYGVDDRLPGVPTSGLFVPEALSSGATVSASADGTIITLDNGEYFELSDGTRYTCTSAAGCEVADGTVTRGSVTGRAAGTGEVDRFPSFQGVSSPDAQSYTVGTAIDTLTLPAASGGDGPLTYRLSPTVPGLTFDADTRQLTGTPTTADTYAMTYTVTDEDGDTDSLGFTITVRSAAAVEGSLGVCQVGMLLSSGQSCTYPGTADAFSVNERGRGSFLDRLAGIRIRINSETINGRVYDFAASHQGDGVWRIDRIAGSTEVPPTGGGTEPEDSSPSFGADAGPGDQTYMAGTAIDPLTLPAASGGDGTLTYTLEPEVPGLTFDADTRRLTGTPTSAGTYAMTYIVTDEDGDADSRGFVVVVEAEYGGGEEQGAVNFVGIGLSHIAVSSDGIHWEVVYDDSSDILSGRSFRDVAYGNGLWVLVGNGLVLTSTDGRNWTLTLYDEELDSESDLYDLNGVHYGGGKWVVVGFNSLLTSTDGRNWAIVYGEAWEDHDPNLSYFHANDVDYGDGLWVATGGNEIYESSNAINWVALHDSKTEMCGFFAPHAVAFGEGRWFASGGGIPDHICTRTVEGDWIPYWDLSGRHHGWDIEYGNGNWVAVGNDGVATWQAGGSQGYALVLPRFRGRFRAWNLSSF